LVIPVMMGNTEFEFMSMKYLRHSALQGILYTILYWEGNLFLFKLMKKRFPYPAQTKKIIFILLLLVTVYSILVSVIGILLIEPILFSELHHRYRSEGKIGYLNITISMLLNYFITALYLGADYFERYKSGLIENERIKKEVIISQFELLKQQTSPHFLFNSLNTLISIIPDDPKLAVKYAQHLSNVYRYVLQNQEQNWVTLETELKFARSYFFLNKIRFGEHVSLKINLNEKDKKKMVAPLSLQILIENALKHNVITDGRPLSIEINQSNNQLFVRNNLQRRKNSEGTKLGLQNIINRYKHLSGKTVQIIESTDFFTVSIPLEVA
jgi:two-component system LytT family sensor kinase